MVVVGGGGWWWVVIVEGARRHAALRALSRTGIAPRARHVRTDASLRRAARLPLARASAPPFTARAAQLPAWNGKLIAGFTAGTGKTYGSHAIESWSFWEVLDRNAVANAGQESSWWSSMLGGNGR